MTSFPTEAQSRVVDLAVTPDGKRIVTVGRSEFGASNTPPNSSSASQNGRGDTPNSIAPSMAKCEKRICVYSLADKKLE